MRIGIIEAGYPPPSLIEEFGSYVDMFRQFLGQEHEYIHYKVQEGYLPQHTHAEEAYIITGSSSGVYDNDPWIRSLIEFLRSTSVDTKLVGICFGHQLMAEAFGGKVIQSPKGWGIGLHRYTIQSRQEWMNGDMESIALAASHQDQVVILPPDVEVVASNDFTPLGMLSYTQRKAFSIQLHPEFNEDFAIALMESRRGMSGYTHDQVNEAVTSLKMPNDRERVNTWINQFLKG